MEEWRDVKGYDYYEISSYGRIRSKERMKKGGQGIYKLKPKNMKLVDNGNGYIRANLNQNGIKKREYIHRLVALAFIPNPENKPFINHIDNDPKNNHVENLEWCTAKENSDWMAKQGRNKRTKTWLKHLHESQEKFKKPVIAKNIKSGETIYIENVNGCRKYGFEPSCVCNCCKGIRKTHKGYTFRYAKG